MQRLTLNFFKLKLSEKIAVLKFLPHTDNRPAGLTLIFTQTHIFQVSQKYYLVSILNEKITVIITQTHIFHVSQKCYLVSILNEKRQFSIVNLNFLISFERV